MGLTRNSINGIGKFSPFRTTVVNQKNCKEEEGRFPAYVRLKKNRWKWNGADLHQIGTYLLGGGDYVGGGSSNGDSGSSNGDSGSSNGGVVVVMVVW